MQIAIECNNCHKPYSVNVDEGDLERWKNGEAIQRAMPYLTVSHRELLISGTCGFCFDEMFKEEE